MNSLGERIKKYRKAKGFTQQQLADSIGKSKSIIQKYEANNTNISIDTLNNIADTLGVSFHALLYPEGSESFNTFELEDELVELTSQYSKQIESKILELNNGLDDKIFLERIYQLLESLDVEFVYDKNKDLVYVGSCYLTPSFTKSKGNTVVTNIDSFLLMLKNIISIRNNFFEINKSSSKNIDQVSSEMVEISRIKRSIKQTSSIISHDINLKTRKDEEVILPSFLKNIISKEGGSQNGE